MQSLVVSQRSARTCSPAVLCSRLRPVGGSRTRRHPVPFASQSGLEELLVPDLGDLMSTLSAQTGPRFRRLNKAMAGLLDDYRCFSWGFHESSSVVGSATLNLIALYNHEDVITQTKLFLFYL